MIRSGESRRHLQSTNEISVKPCFLNISVISLDLSDFRLTLNLALAVLHSGPVTFNIFLKRDVFNFQVAAATNGDDFE